MNWSRSILVALTVALLMLGPQPVDAGDTSELRCRLGRIRTVDGYSKRVLASWANSVKKGASFDRTGKEAKARGVLLTEWGDQKNVV